MRADRLEPEWAVKHAMRGQATNPVKFFKRAVE